MDFDHEAVTRRRNGSIGKVWDVVAVKEEHDSPPEGALGLPMTAAKGLAGGLMVLLAVVSGCSQHASKTIGIRASDVDYVEFYRYAYSDDPTWAQLSLITDRQEIARLVEAFTDVPVTPLTHTSAELESRAASGMRFVLRDGGSVELTQMFVGRMDVVVFWPEGTVVDTRWGSDLGLSGTPSDPAANRSVDPAEVPRAKVP